MTWVINCVLVFSVIGLAFAWVGTVAIESVDSGKGGLFLCAFAFLANILIIILSKLGVD